MPSGRVVAAWRPSAALAIALAASGPLAAEEPAAPPTAERVQLDETAGRVDEALAGWAARYLGVKAPAERAAAMQRYLALASKKAAEADAWLVDSVQRSGAGVRVVAGRRAVLVTTDDVVPDADVNRVAALLDAAALAAQRVTGSQPLASKTTKDDTRPRDSQGRLLLRAGPVGKPAAAQAFDGWAATDGDEPDGKFVGAALAHSLGAACARVSLGVVPNRRARILDAAVSAVVTDLVAREIAEPAAIARAERLRTRAKEAYEGEWAPGCLPGEAIPRGAPLTHLFFVALDAERAAGREPAAAMLAYLEEPRRDAGSDRGRVALGRDLAMEPLAAVWGPAAVAVFRRAGVLPSGLAFEEMKARVIADDLCREAASLNVDATRDIAARTYRSAAEALAPSVASDELVVEALQIEAAEDAKKARSAVQKLGLLEGFDFLAPLPADRIDGDVVAAARLLPLAVATAPSRHAFKVTKPVEVNLKWAEVKDPYDRLVQHTPWGDKRGITWGGAAVATVKWTKDLGRTVRLRPCRDQWTDVVVLAGGRVAEPWPDGSVLVPGAKGTEIVLASPSRITCSVPWRDARSVDADLAAAAAEPDALLALRPWAARRVQAALPHVVAKLAALPDADLVREIVLLAPYRGGDAAACDAMLARAKDRPAVLAAYLDVCRGTRDVAVLAKLVALATAEGVAAETVTRVQYVLDGALFRKVTETGPALAALFERGRKWMASAAFAEGEEIRDLHDATTSFRVAASPDAWGRACLAPGEWNGRRGEGYLALDLPEGSGACFLAVRWQPTPGGRLTLAGLVTDGKRTKPFSADAPARVGEKAEWALDVFDLGSIPRGEGVVLAIDDPCAAGYRLDAIAVGPKPLE